MELQAFRYLRHGARGDPEAASLELVGVGGDLDGAFRVDGLPELVELNRDLVEKEPDERLGERHARSEDLVARGRIRRPIRFAGMGVQAQDFFELRRTERLR